MERKEEIRAKSMELTLKFMELTSELPLTNDFANENGHGEEETNRVFKYAVELSRKFENFISKGDSV